MPAKCEVGSDLEYGFCVAFVLRLGVGVTVSLLLSQASQGWPAVLSREYNLDKLEEASGATLPV